MTNVRYLDNRKCTCPLCATHWSDRTMSPHWRAVRADKPLRLTRRGWVAAVAFSMTAWAATVFLGNAIAQYAR